MDLFQEGNTVRRALELLVYEGMLALNCTVATN